LEKGQQKLNYDEEEEENDDENVNTPDGRKILQLRVVSAEFYKDLDKFELGDPYILIKYGTQPPQRTTMKKNTKTPVFNESFI
jgi:Ca2+-dependent lipid-binding protein